MICVLLVVDTASALRHTPDRGRRVKIESAADDIDRHGCGSRDLDDVTTGAERRTATRLVCPLSIFNPLMGTLKPQSNMVIGTLAVDGWAVTFGTARRDLGGLWPRPVPSSLYQM